MLRVWRDEAMRLLWVSSQPALRPILGRSDRPPTAYGRLGAISRVESASRVRIWVPDECPVSPRVDLEYPLSTSLIVFI